MALRIEDRLTTIALVVIGGLTLLLGVFNIRQTIKATFFGELGASDVTLNQAEQNQLNNLRFKDTDSDGVTDYDELYVYNTSPYLADSDSDGTDDNTEIAAGTDPNCNGADCMQIRTGNQTVSTNTAPSGTVNTSSTTNTAVAGTAGTPTTAEIRQTLLNAGVAQEMLDQIDDATLLQLYQETLTETSATPGTTNTATDANYADLLEDESITSTQDLENLTPDQIRQLLISSGIDEAILNQVSDADLLVIYKQALGEATAETEQ